jgi:hypothetical protein
MRLGFGVLVLYAVLALFIPRNGFWTLDNGLKYLAIRHQVSQPLYPLNITLTQSGIDPWNEAIPLIPPFVHRQDSRTIPVFPPAFIVCCAVAWKVFGQWVLPWISWIAALGILTVFALGFRSPITRSSTVGLLLLALASPLAFYALSLWEHTAAILFLLAGVALTYGRRNASSLWTWFIGGLLLGIGGMLRLEIWLVALSWLIASYQYSIRVHWTTMLLGIAFAGLIWIAGNFWWTGSFLPLQFSENWNVYQTFEGSSPVATWLMSRWESVGNLIFAAHPNGTTNLILNIAMISGILMLAIGKKPWTTKLGHGVILGTYLAFLILLFNLDHPIASTAFTGGLLWCCPWIVLIWMNSGNHFDAERLRTAAFLAILLIILLTPISRGIHVGPRVLLGVIPLLALLGSITLFRVQPPATGYATIWILLAMTLIYQGHGIQLLAKQKAYNADLTAQVSQLKTPIILTDMWWLPADLARTWNSHSYLYVATRDVLQDVLFHMKVAGQEGFVFITEYPRTFAELKYPIQMVEHQEWDGGERAPLVVEQIAVGSDSLMWADLSTQVGLRKAKALELDRALPPLEAAVRWVPNDPDAWFRLGTVKLQMWDEDGAKNAFETAIEIDPGHQRSLEALRRWAAED